MENIPPLTAQDANRALDLPADTVGVLFEWRFNHAGRRWEVRRLGEQDEPVTAWLPVGGKTEAGAVRYPRCEFRELTEDESTAPWIATTHIFKGQVRVPSGQDLRRDLFVAGWRPAPYLRVEGGEVTEVNPT